MRFIFILLACLMISNCQHPLSRIEDTQGALVESSPNSDTLPAVLQTTTQIRQIALLLPSSGKHASSAQIIRNGFFASYELHSGVRPTIRTYDTSGQSIQKLYDVAIQEGADLVVGPLDKDEVFQLATTNFRHLGAPVLALNHHPSVKLRNPQFVQFSLSPESEALQLAHQAFKNGYRTATLIVPNDTWGQRIGATFSANWQRLGGRIYTQVNAQGGDQGPYIRQLLGIQQNGKTFDKDAPGSRPNSAIDVVIMAAKPEQARQWKPLVDFYYGENLPVYATSSIYNGTPDRDLNGIIFCDMPGILDGRLKRMGSDSTHQRLFGMGMDAYELSLRLISLESQPRREYAGTTGYLSINSNYQIERRLVWARIQNGVPNRL